MGGVDKVFAHLAGKPLIVQVVDIFQSCNAIDQIVIVLRETKVERGLKLAAEFGWSKVTDVCTGGDRRQDSVAQGLSRLDHCHWVVIHDGARPLVTEDLIERGLETARETGAAAAALPVTDTIKIAGEHMVVEETPPRNKLWAIQTPQVFRSDIIREAFRGAKAEVTDDASMVEQLGYKVRLYMGANDNIKITTPDDLALAEILWNRYER